MATAAAYDLRQGGKVVLPMFWHYTALALEPDGHGQRTFHWPDGVEGRRYTTLVLVLDDEQLHREYADEFEFNRLPPNARAALGSDVLPLLVRLQYMNECHSLNTVPHASRDVCIYSALDRAVGTSVGQWARPSAGTLRVLPLCVVARKTTRDFVHVRDAHHH